MAPALAAARAACDQRRSEIGGDQRPAMERAQHAAGIGRQPGPSGVRRRAPSPPPPRAPTRAVGDHAYYTAELYRRRAHTGDLERAVDAYQRAIVQPDAPPAAWRGLGLSLRQLGRDADARDAWREYVKRDPQAEDRAMIESWLQ